MNRACVRFFVFVLLGSGLAMAPGNVARAKAQNPMHQQPEDGPPTRRLTLHPAAEPRPALKYKLLPELLDRRPGNAALWYNKIALTFRGGPEFREEREKESQWNDNDLPLEELPREEARAVVQRWRQVFDDLEFAARRDDCDWELPYRERNPIAMRLNDIQECRSYARLLKLKTRLQIAEGDLEGAIATLKTGYALARHVACGETFIHALVGMAISGLMNEEVEELVQQPAAPNLYWSLSSLPRPFIDLRISREEEYGLIYLMYPELQNIESEQHGPEFWNRLLDKLTADVAQWNDAAWKDHSKVTLAARAVQRYPDAKRSLVAAGRSPEEVAAMPVAQVVVLYSLQIYDESRDDVFKWLGLPYWEARAGFDNYQEVASAAREKEILPLFTVLGPATGPLANASAHNERAFAMLRTIEALRLFASHHKGQAPTRLEDIVAVPVPNDPLTGLSFIYRVEDDTAVLEAPLPPDMSPRHFGKRYEIRFSH